MKGKCHHLMGEYLVQNYLEASSRRYKRAFMIGCIEPDRNPATYFKGSLRSQWMRGHNWGNTQPYIYRLIRRLEKKKQLKLLDYYNLGKLIHYVTDAFTYAHNPEFTADLKVHCEYEENLQQYFPMYIRKHDTENKNTFGSAAEAVCNYHQDYLKEPMGIQTDSFFSISACSAVLASITAYRTASALN